MLRTIWVLGQFKRCFLTLRNSLPQPHWRLLQWNGQPQWPPGEQRGTFCLCDWLLLSQVKGIPSLLLGLLHYLAELFLQVTVVVWTPSLSKLLFIIIQSASRDNLYGSGGMSMNAKMCKIIYWYTWLPFLTFLLVVKPLGCCCLVRIRSRLFRDLKIVSVLKSLPATEYYTFELWLDCVCGLS